MKLALIGHGNIANSFQEFFESIGIYVLRIDGHSKRFVRVQKKFLGPDVETINGRTRMADLFRVVYIPKLSTRDTQEYKELESIDKSLSESLNEDSEYFHDVDVVVNLDNSTESEPLPSLGFPSFAINELYHSSLIQYGTDFGNYLENKKAIIVSTLGQTKLPLELETWAKEGNKLYLITPRGLNYESIVSAEFLDFIHNDFDLKKKSYQEELFKWRSLEDYEKVKVKKPQEPFPSVELYQFHNISSVDKLIDRDGMFVTVEKSPFQDSEGNIKTFAVDGLISMAEFKASPNGESQLRENEPGYFPLWKKELNEDNIKLEQNLVLEELEKYFTRK